MATAGELPSSGNTQGDAYLVQADDSLHVWDSSSWISGGSIQGPQGIEGPQGTAGADSTVPGPVGPQGATGVEGPQGLPGQAGDQGFPGPQGPVGLQGVTGDQGIQGIQGPAGDQGLTGLQGSTGEDGATGPAGDTGPVGPIGPVGADSTVAGPQGLKGDTGDTGPAGTTDYNNLLNKPTLFDGAYSSLSGSPTDVSAFTNDSGYLTAETNTSLSINANILTYTDEGGVETNIDLSTYLDDTNLARISTGILAADTGIATFTRDDNSTFTLDLSDLLNITLADISVGTPASASGNGALSYDNTTGIFTYAPPVIPADLSDLTDTTNVIPADLSDLTDISNVIPTDFSDLTDNNNSLAGTIASSDLDMGGNKVLFANVYNNEVDLPSASTYHGMFAHVHGTGKGYYAHAGSWIPLATESQVANITFNDINSKPTTIAGYGITDAVVDFADLGTTPTTLAGYGITDVVPTELSDLTDVSISTPSDGQIMMWNASNNRFEVGEIGSAITTFEKGIYEVATNKNNATSENVSGDAAANSGGTVIFDTSLNGNLFHYWNNQMSSTYWTADITNVENNNYQFTAVTLVIRQQAWGNTSTVGSLPTTYKINGQTYTVQWSDGVAPSATINGIDVIQLTIMPVQTTDGTQVPIFNGMTVLGTHTSHPRQI